MIFTMKHLILVALLLAALVSTGYSAPDCSGGDKDVELRWFTPDSPGDEPIAPVELCCGGTLVFQWKEDKKQGVMLVPTADCPTEYTPGENGQEEIAPVTEGGEARYTFDTAGTFYFVSQQEDKCDRGAKVTVTVTCS